MTKHKFKWDFWTVVTLCTVLVFAVFLVYPLFSLFASGFKDPASGSFTMTIFAKFFQKKYYYSAFFVYICNCSKCYFR